MILILNQFPKEDPAPTSRYLHQWAEALQQQGETIQWISGSSSYQPPFSSFILRAFHELLTSIQILWNGLWAEDPKLIIVSSSPPGILVIATLLKLWHQIPLIHWAMDLHPDLSEALGEKPPFRRTLKFLMRLCYPLCDYLLTLDPTMQRYLRTTYQVDSLITPLWPLLSTSSMDEPSLTSPPHWIYSGNLGKAHEWKTLIQTQIEIENNKSPFRLLLQGNAFRRLPSNLILPNQIAFSDYVSEEKLLSTLLSCHLLVATQNPLTTGLLWPCKLALLSILPRPLLWIGAQDSFPSTYFKNRPHTGIFEPGESKKIAEWIQQYESVPPPQEFQTWIEQQPTKSAFLEQARKVILPLLKRSA